MHMQTTERTIRLSRFPWSCGAASLLRLFPHDERLGFPFLHQLPARRADFGNDLILRLRINLLPIRQRQFQRRLSLERYDRMPRSPPARLARAEMLAEPFHITAAFAHESIASPADFVVDGVRVHGVILQSKKPECK